MLVIERPNVIAQHFYDDLPAFFNFSNRQKTQVSSLALDYIFKNVSAQSFAQGINKIASMPVRSIEVRRNLLKDGNLMKNGKLFLLQKATGQKRPIDIGQDKKLWSLCTPEQKRQFRKLSYNAPVTKEEFDDLIMYCLNGVDVYTKKLVRRKCRFIKQSQGIDYSDIESVVILEALQNLFFMYPRFDSELHALNIMKRMVRNFTMNYIETFTRQKVQRIENVDGGFRSKMVPIHTEAAMAYFQQDTLVQEAAQKEYKKLSLSIEIDRLLSKYTGKKKQLIELCMGRYDKCFSAYLERKGITKRDNDEWLDTVEFKIYLDQVIEYLQVPKQKAYKFMEKIKDILKEYV